MVPLMTVSLAEYLESVYRPDCDYIDGEIRERNMGEFDHADWQLGIGAYLRAKQKQLGIYAVTEWRIQVGPNRFRIPDICVVLGARPTERYLTSAPFLVIEILSERDTFESIQDRLEDYLRMGVPHIWIVSPRTRRGWIYSPGTITEAPGGVLKTTDPVIELRLAEIAAED